MIGLQTFFTVGPKMVKAWPFKTGSNVRQCAGEIHGDFEKHFTSAKVLSGLKFMKYPNLQTAEAQMNKVGENYVVQDGDVLIIDHSAR